MNSHKAAINYVRETIKTLSAEKPELRAKLFGLKFDATGKRRPETGQERCDLKNHYAVNTQCYLRSCYIAYGLLRGRPYKTLEATCYEEPSVYLVSTIIQKAFGEDREATYTWKDSRIRSLIVDGVDIVPEPYVPPAKPKGFFTALVERVLGV
jgi:hypothetical protein